MRGHGKSDDPVVGVPYSHAEDLNVLMEYLKIDKAVLVGLSSGGKVAIAFALTHPEKVAAMVTADSVIDGFSYFGNGGFLTRFIKVFQLGRQGKLKKALGLWLADPLFAPARRNPQLAQKLKKIVYDHKGFRFLKKDPAFWPKPKSIKRLSDIKSPTLVILGDLDIPDMNAISQIIATQVKDAQLKIIKDCGHMSNMEKPAEFNRLVLDFIKSKVSIKH
jgi:pimeloyl-ACP methyl ester carboxylesterase